MFLKKKVDKSIDMPPNEWYYVNIKRAEAQRKKARRMGVVDKLIILPQQERRRYGIIIV